MIRKACLTVLGFIAAATIGGQPAAASTSPMTLWPVNTLDMRLGAFFPGSSGDKFFGGETQLTAGLDYHLSSSGGLTPSATDAYFDYMGGARNSGYVHSGGIGLDVRSITGPAFFGAGLGLYNTAVRFNDGTSGSKTSAGGKLFAGMRISRDTSLQLDYHIMPSALGVNPSGLGVELGFHL
jgi:hypothetical protein